MTDLPRDLQARVRATRLYQDLGVELAEVSEKVVTATMDADERHCNLDGVVQGGLYALLADTAMGCAARAVHAADRENKTLRLDVDFHAPARAGERLIAEARVTHRAGRLTWTEATLAVLAGGERRTVGNARGLNYAVPPRSPGTSG